MYHIYISPCLPHWFIPLCEEGDVFVKTKRRPFRQQKLPQPVLCDICGWFKALIWLEITQNHKTVAPDVVVGPRNQRLLLDCLHTPIQANERLQQVGLELDFFIQVATVFMSPGRTPSFVIVTPRKSWQKMMKRKCRFASIYFFMNTKKPDKISFKVECYLLLLLLLLLWSSWWTFEKN